MRILACARGIALLAASFLLAACAVGPNYERPEIHSPERFYGEVGPTEAQSLADLPWWEVFDDEVLQRLISEAIVSNYDLRQAIARVEQANALVGVARSDLFPQIGYQGSAERGRSLLIPGIPPRTLNLFSGAFNLAWEIDLWGRIRRATEAAEATLLATEEARRGVLLSLVSGVAQRYFELIELDAEVEIARTSAASFKESLDLFERRYLGGVGNELAVSRAQASLAQVAATIPAFEAEIVAKENEINVLLGRNPGPIPRGEPLTAQRTVPETPAGLPSALLERRPDVRESEDEIISANAQVGVAVANFFPQLGLTSLYGGASTDLSNLVKGTGNVWNIAASLSGPIFTGGQNLEQYRAQVAAWEEAKFQYEQTVLTAFSEVSNLLTLQEKLVSEREQRQIAVDALQKSVKLAFLRYDLGLASYYEVLEAQQQLFPAETDLAQVQRDQLLVVAELYQALGGGWSMPATHWEPTAEPNPAPTP